MLHLQRVGFLVGLPGEPLVSSISLPIVIVCYLVPQKVMMSLMVIISQISALSAKIRAAGPSMPPLPLPELFPCYPLSFAPTRNPPTQVAQGDVTRGDTEYHSEEGQGEGNSVARRESCGLPIIPTSYVLFPLHYPLHPMSSYFCLLRVSFFVRQTLQVVRVADKILPRFRLRLTVSGELFERVS